MIVDDVMAIFRRVLETTEVTADSDFFAVGGDSAEQAKHAKNTAEIQETGRIMGVSSQCPSARSSVWKRARQRG